MQALLESLHNHPHFLTIIQIAVDVILIALVLIYFTRRPKGISMPGREELLSSFERIIQDTKEIANAFDANLQERQQLIQQLLAQLDSRLEEIHRSMDQLQRPQPQPEQGSQSEDAPRNPEQLEMVRLANQGLDAETISQRVKKPRGEVDLFLKLRHMSKRPGSE